MARLFIFIVLLIGGSLRSQAADDKNPPPTSLQEITRQAEERLQRWDAEDAQEEQFESRYWWIGLVQMAVSIACGHPFAMRSFPITGRGGLAVQRPATRAAVPSGSSAFKKPAS